jgi:hypothetical protein
MRAGLLPRIFFQAPLRQTLGQSCRKRESFDRNSDITAAVFMARASGMLARRPSPAYLLQLHVELRGAIS